MRDTSAYHFNGRRLLSVTEAITMAGLTDFSGVPRDTLEAARQRGQDVHEWLDGLDSGLLRSTLIDPPEHIEGYVKAWVRFRDETGFEPSLVENPGVSAAFMFAGTPDRIGRLRGDPCIVEIKAAWKLDAWVSLQTSGYELLQGDTFRRIAVQLLPDGRYRMQEHKHRMADRSGFMGALALAKWKRGRGAPLPEDDIGEE